MRRLGRIVLGYLAAAAIGGVASAFGAVAEWIQAGEAMQIAHLPGMVLFVFLSSLAFGLLPALLLIAVGELWPVRNVYYWVAAGLLIGAGLPLVFSLSWAQAAMGCAGGIAAGWTYWRIAGRYAGFLPVD